MLSVIVGYLASITSFANASNGLVEKSVEAEVRSSDGIRTSSAAVQIPAHCHFRDHEVQILREEPSGTFKPRTTSDSTSFNVTIGRDPNSQAERTIVLVVVAFKSAATGPDLYLKARLSIRMSFDSDTADKS
jgi:hypothetical protein